MENKKQIYIIVSFSFLTVLFLILFFINPLIKDISQKSEELLAQRNGSILLERQFNEAANFKQKYEAYSPNLKKADDLLADSENPVVFIEFLEKTASDLNLKLQISAPSFIKEGNKTYQNIQLSSSGKFDETLKFIRKLEASPFLIGIQKINISKAKEEISANITIKVLSK